jgi:hypothetical protein
MVYEVKALAVGLQIIHESCQYVHEGVIRTPDPQIRSLQRRGDVLDHSMLKCAHTEQ